MRTARSVVNKATSRPSFAPTTARSCATSPAVSVRATTPPSLPRRSSPRLAPRAGLQWRGRPVRAWLYRVAANMAGDELKRRGRRPCRSRTSPPRPTTPRRSPTACDRACAALARSGAAARRSPAPRRGAAVRRGRTRPRAKRRCVPDAAPAGRPCTSRGARGGRSPRPCLTIAHSPPSSTGRSRETLPTPSSASSSPCCWRPPSRNRFEITEPEVEQALNRVRPAAQAPSLARARRRRRGARRGHDGLADPCRDRRRTSAGRTRRRRDVLRRRAGPRGTPRRLPDHRHLGLRRRSARQGAHPRLHRFGSDGRNTRAAGRHRRALAASEQHAHPRAFLSRADSDVRRLTRSVCALRPRDRRWDVHAKRPSV